ncbi:MAG: transporter [Candidatus Amulumruptor caecigallinarius]|nr:MAG: transporter [Candidatus Amulumruptor caecigallinarius]
MFTSFIPSHEAAQWLLGVIRHMLDAVGLRHEPRIESFLYIFIVAAVAVSIGWAVRRGILYVVRRLAGMKHTALDNELLHSRVFTKCSHVIVPMVLLSLVPFTLEYESQMRVVVMRILYVYAIMAGTYAMTAVVDFIWWRYNRRENTRNLPLQGIANTMKGVLWMIAFIVSVSVLIDKSPAALLTGLGAFAAALMLIFKDSILGFVAGIQLSQNDMVRIGDWIVVPDTPVNGNVIDISLSTVKVRNFDNTIVTCPPYMLVQQSFQNWRGMGESGARRVSYDLTVENSSIHAADDTFIDAMAAKYPMLKSWVDGVRESHAGAAYSTGLMEVNGSIETNLGLFRAYVCRYLINHPQVAKDQQMLVRLNTPVSQGTTLNVYVFTATTDWTLYEAIKSEILEHITAAAASFGIRLYTPITGIVGGEPGPTVSPSTLRPIVPSGSSEPKANH